MLTPCKRKLIYTKAGCTIFPAAKIMLYPLTDVLLAETVIFTACSLSSLEGARGVGSSGTITVSFFSETG